MTGVAVSANEGHANLGGKVSNLRRSQRVCLNVDVEVTSQRGSELGAAEQTRTLIVSAHGALIHLQAGVKAGDLLKMRNLKTNEAVTCRVVDVNAGNTGVPEVGLEFVKAQVNFWHIAFPPLDWSPRGPESKVSGPQVVPGSARTPSK